MTDATIEELRAWLVRLDLALVNTSQRLDALDDAVADATGSGDITSSAPASWQHHSVDDWVEKWFIRVFADRGAVGTRWCAYWWAHGEALLRLTALWRTWEVAQRDRDRGTAHWLTGVADPILRELWDSAGPFRQCTPEHHVPVKDPLKSELRSTT